MAGTATAGPPDRLIAGAAEEAPPLDGSTKDGAHGVQGQYRVVEG